MADVTSTFSGLSSTESSNAPLGTTVIGAGLDENLRMIQSHQAAWRDQTAWGTLTLTSVAGTNTITATLAAAGSVTFGPTSYLTGARFFIVPANTNTGATTLNITSPNGGSALGAKNVFWNGAACVGGELRQNIPAVVIYDGTQFHIISNGFNAPFLDTHAVVEGSADSTKKLRIEVDGITTATTRVLTWPDADLTIPAVTAAGDILQASASGVLAKLAIGTARQVPTVNAGATALAYANPITLGTVQASTSGTSIDFTSIPAGVRRITVMFVGVSLSGTDSILVQIGDSGGLETSGYISSSTGIQGGVTSVTVNSTAGFIIQSQAAGNVLSGTMVLNLVDAATFLWVSSHSTKTSTGVTQSGGGDKALSAVLDRLSIVTNGTNTFDAGSINICYE